MSLQQQSLGNFGAHAGRHQQAGINSCTESNIVGYRIISRALKGISPCWNGWCFAREFPYSSTNIYHQNLKEIMPRKTLAYGYCLYYLQFLCNFEGNSAGHHKTISKSIFLEEVLSHLNWPGVDEKISFCDSILGPVAVRNAFFLRLLAEAFRVRNSKKIAREGERRKPGTYSS